MQIQKALSPNYSSGRNGKKIIAIVNHITAGSYPGCLSWLRNPAAQASAHYLVTKAGEVFQLVADENTAWHAGVVNRPSWALYDGTNPNRCTIGIEFENLGGGELTEPQYQAGLELHKLLIPQYSIPADRNHIIGHYQIDSVNRPNDPGAHFPWERLIQDLNKPQWEKVKLIYKGKVLAGYLIEGISYAPVRDLLTALGIALEWKPELNAVFIEPVFAGVTAGGAGTVKVVTGHTIIEGKLIDGKAYAPIRILAESLGYRIDWNAGTKDVVIMI